MQKRSSRATECLFLAVFLTVVSVSGNVKAENPCEGVTCTGHGACIEKKGEPFCACHQGYTPDASGINCVPQQDSSEASQTTVQDPCKSVICGKNSSCKVNNGTALCSCDTGFTPDESGQKCVLAGGVIAPQAPSAQPSKPAQCITDSECKGLRVCNEGKCEDYDPSSETATPETLSDKRVLRKSDDKSWFKGYGEVSGVLLIRSWGHLETDISSQYSEYRDDVSTKAIPGIRLAGYGVASEEIHVGGYFSFNQGDLEIDNDEYMNNIRTTFSNTGLGLAMKMGTPSKSRRFMAAFGLDIGLSFIEMAYFEDGDVDNDTFVGLEIVPKVTFDIMLVRRNGFKFALPITVGIKIIPVATLEPYDDADGWEYSETDGWEYSEDSDVSTSMKITLRAISLCISLGTTFGG